MNVPWEYVAMWMSPIDFQNMCFSVIVIHVWMRIEKGINDVWENARTLYVLFSPYGCMENKKSNGFCTFSHVQINENRLSDIFCFIWLLPMSPLLMRWGRVNWLIEKKIVGNHRNRVELTDDGKFKRQEDIQSPHRVCRVEPMACSTIIITLLNLFIYGLDRTMFG